MNVGKYLPTVQVAEFFQGKKTGSVLMVPEDERGRGINGDGTREGVGVGRLAWEGEKEGRSEGIRKGLIQKKEGQRNKRKINIRHIPACTWSVSNLWGEDICVGTCMSKREGGRGIKACRLLPPPSTYHKHTLRLFRPSLSCPTMRRIPVLLLSPAAIAAAAAVACRCFIIKRLHPTSLQDLAALSCPIPSLRRSWRGVCGCRVDKGPNVCLTWLSRASPGACFAEAGQQPSATQQHACRALHCTQAPAFPLFLLLLHRVRLSKDCGGNVLSM